MNPGQQISHYTILGPIGKGGMGIVYKAEDTKLGRPVALKFLPPDSQTALGEDTAAKERFLREARIAARLNHPHICPIYDVDDANGQVFFAMAYIEGRPLNALIAEGMTNAQALEIGIQIASGLEEARRQGIVHRDIKASNIVVNPQGQAYILDFGLALAADSSRLTVTGGVAGTPAYMSPEQAQGLPVDHRTDIWSLGILLFEMLTGRRPFERDKDLQVLYGIVHNAPTPLNALRPDLPPDYQSLIEKALAKNPNERWQTAGEIADDLRRLRDGRSSSANNPTVTIAAIPTQPPPPKNTRRNLAAALALVVVAVGAGFAYWRTRPTLPQEKHIAILPFNVIGGDDNLRAITDGLVETLTARLSDAEDLDTKVLVVPASEIRARNIKSAEEARNVYGATLVVTGTAEVVGKSVQLLVNLIDATTTRQTGARTVDFSLANPLAARDNALAGIVRLLQMQTLKEKQSAGETANAAAYADYLKGRGYLARYDQPGNLDRAVASFTAATKADPSFAHAFAFLAEAEWRKAFGGNDKPGADRALRYAEQSVALNPNLALTHAKLGEIYAQTGRREKAIEELQAALRLEPRAADARRALAELYARMGRTREAEDSLVEVTQSRPGDWYAHFSLGLFLLSQKRYDEAEKAFARAQTLAPGNEVVHRNLASLFLSTGRYREAAQQARQALQLSPTGRAHSSLGLSYYYERKYPEAAAELQEAVRHDPGYYVAWGNLGTAYRRIPNSESRAKEAFSKAIELALQRLEILPDNAAVLANLAEYYAKQGDPAKALAMADRVPVNERLNVWSRLAFAYNAAGRKEDAVRLVAEALAKSTAVFEVRDDPDLAPLLNEPALHKWRDSR